MPTTSITDNAFDSLVTPLSLPFFRWRVCQSKLFDLLSSLSNPMNVIRDLQTLLGRFYADLMNIFRHYSAVGRASSSQQQQSSQPSSAADRNSAPESITLKRDINTTDDVDSGSI